MNILISDFVLVLLIFLRIFTAFFAAPVFGHKSFPVLSKVFLSLIIAYIVFLINHNIKINVEYTMGWLAINALKEMITGLILGFMLSIIFHAISYAGTLIGFNMELSMANVLNPADGTNNNVIGQALYMAAILIFLLINGHYYIISGLLYSFTIIPLGKFTVTHSVYDLLVKYSGSIFVIALKIASPIVVSFFLIYIASGVLARVIPQMQVFFVTQPLMLGLGFFLLLALTPIYVYVIKGLLQSYESNLLNLVKAMAQ